MMGKNLIIAILVILMIFQIPTETVHAQVQQTSLKKSIREYLLSQHVTGSVLVGKKNQIIFNEGVGFADRIHSKPNLPSTTFPIGSITKAMVAVSIMQLQENGKLSVNEPLNYYIPEFPNSRKIKLIHLLNHTSGIPSPPFLAGRYRNPIDIVTEAAKASSKFSAGEKWDYNDLNYLILGVIIEKVTHEPLHQYIKQHIFNRAGMYHSGFITDKNPAPFTSTGYVKVANQYLPVRRLNTSMLFGCGDIYSTPYDLFLFDYALMSERLVSKFSLKQMLSPGSKSNYGMGLYINGNRVYSRGVLRGWEALHVYYKDETAIVILLNDRDKSKNIHKLSMDIYSKVILSRNLPY